MLENYVVLEDKKFQHDGIIAIPESSYDEQLVAPYYWKAGVLQGIAASDFRKHNYWWFRYLPLNVLPSLGPSHAGGIVKKNFETLADIMAEQTNSLAPSYFDAAVARTDDELIWHILDYETINGDISLVRFSGTDDDNQEITRGVLLLFGKILEFRSEQSFLR